ncbi:putative GAF-like domain superfamily protein [Helianthus annuus]|uniref:GAF-like domain superfamily protein n=2 Tax=Helianthus annuus TaxID=4232 RepID=A0A9K3HSI3_HELAN|nr:putative GAF-like domain superfamily protein [Helianthus annuus]KAJ0511113.1 putative GAF-like domain superfamily protein [Helianthus annuus]
MTDLWPPCLNFDWINMTWICISFDRVHISLLLNSDLSNTKSRRVLESSEVGVQLRVHKLRVHKFDMDNAESDLFDDIDIDKYFQDSDIQVLHKLKVFHNNHVDQTRNVADIHIYQQICSALSAMRFYEQIISVQFWAAVVFGSQIVLTTCGQPFGFTMSTNEFWSYRVACLDHNSYVDCNKRVCIGLPGRVFLSMIPEWTNDVEKYNDKHYPQLQDAKRSKIQGSFSMPVIKDGKCIGVLEFAITNKRENFTHEMDEVRTALQNVGLQSSDQNESINFDTLENYSPVVESPSASKKGRYSKSKEITRNDITKLFGVPKAKATKICGIWHDHKTLAKNTFTKAHKRYGVDKWPCIRGEIVKSSAHKALIEHAEAFLKTSSDVARRIKHMNSQLMQDDNDDITFEGNLGDTPMDDLISNALETADGKRVREQVDESASPVNKRSRN